MHFPWIGITFFTVSTIICSWLKRKHQKLQRKIQNCEPFPQDNERPSTGYYWVSGPLQCEKPFLYHCAILHYQIYAKHNFNCTKRFYDSPIQYALNLNINGANIDELKSLIPLELEQEFFSIDPDLNNSTVNTFTNDTDTFTYSHQWYGARMNQIYTVIGKWDYLQNRFVYSNNINIVSTHTVKQIIENLELWIHIIMFVHKVSYIFSAVFGALELFGYYYE